MEVENIKKICRNAAELVSDKTISRVKRSGGGISSWLVAFVDLSSVKISFDIENQTGLVKARDKEDISFKFDPATLEVEEIPKQ